MKRTQSLIAGIALAGLALSGAARAHDRDDVRWSVTIGSPVAVPVYRPTPRVVLVPSVPMVEHRAYDREYRVYREPTRWDIDGDGIPNRYDRVYNPRWDVDGDGIPNRRDPWPDVPQRGRWGR